MTAPMWTPADALLDEIAEQLQLEDPMEGTCWFDIQERTLVHLMIGDPFTAAEDATGLPQWMQEQHAIAARMRAERERYREVPAECESMSLYDFLDSIEDERLEQALERAKNGRPGGFRGVREELARRGQEGMFEAFRTQWERELATEWLVDQGLLAETD